MKISVVIITKNEERNIGPCLDLLDWADDVIVVDSESTDRTVEICGKYANVKAIVKPYRGEASQRNYGIELTQGEWILVLDADERITPELRAELLAFRSGPSPDMEGYLIPYKHFVGGRWMSHGDYHPDPKLRFIRRDQRFTKEMHAYVPATRVGLFQGGLIHYTYKNLEDALTKINRYTSVEAGILKDGFTFKWYTWLRPFYYFFKVYVLLGAYKNGPVGLMSSFLRLYNNFSLYYKIWELQKGLKETDRGNA